MEVVVAGLVAVAVAAEVGALFAFKIVRLDTLEP